MGDKIGVLSQGRLVQTGAPREIYADPRNTFVARAVGSPPMNLIEGRLVAGRAVMAEAGCELPVNRAASSGAIPEGRPLVFGVRPEDIELAEGAPAEARVHDVENHGVEQIVTLRAGAVTLRATVSAQMRVEIEEAVRFSWDPRKVVLFDGGTGVSLRHSA